MDFSLFGSHDKDLRFEFVEIEAQTAGQPYKGRFFIIFAH